MNVIDISNRKAPSNHLPELPPMRDLADRLRGGDTINAIAAEYERTPRLIRSRLNKAGFASSGEPTEPTPWPTREKLPSFWRPFERADWMEAGICGQADPEEFFPEHRAQGSIAKDICLSCPVREQCLAYAIEHSEYGIWGATDDKDRRKAQEEREGVRMSPMSNSEARKREQAKTERWVHHDATVRALIADAYAEGYEAAIRHAHIIADAAIHEVPC